MNENWSGSMQESNSEKVFSVFWSQSLYLVSDKAILYNYGTKVIELIFNLENLDNTDSSLSEIFQNGNYF